MCLDKIPRQVAVAMLCFGLVLATLNISTRPASAQDSKIDDSCPEIWNTYVELVATAEKAMTKPPIMLFTDDSGQVHDCLGKGVSQKDLEKLSIVSRDIARIILETKPSEPGSFATNHCTTSKSAIFKDFAYASIDLPLDQAILGNPMCRKRIENSLARMVSNQPQP